MEHLDFLLQWQNWLMLVLGVILGMTIGALPGLTATMGVAIFSPLVFFVPPEQGLCLLLGIYNAAMFGGAISAILINTPGTPAAIATTFDGYPLCQKGRPGLALGLSALGSAGGGLFSFVCLALIARPLADLALQFGPREFFALAVFGLAMMISFAGDSVVRGVMMGAFGLFLATIGMDPIHGLPRLTFGVPELMGGLSFVPVMVGLFGLSEILIRVASDRGVAALPLRISEDEDHVLPTRAELRQVTPAFVIGCVVGTIVGAIPGTGGDLAGLLAWDRARKASRRPQDFGKGSIEGVVAAETANNSVVGGAMATMLMLGIPGDAVTAILIGSLMMWGVNPGPQLYQNHPGLVLRIIAIMTVATLLSLAASLYRTKFVARWVLKLPEHVLISLVMILCVVGTYAVNASLFDVWVMLASGAFGVVMRRFKFPLGPLVLGLLLGPMAEINLRRSLVISGGNVLDLFARPIPAVLLGFAAVFLVRGVLRNQTHVQTGDAAGVKFTSPSHSTAAQ